MKRREVFIAHDGTYAIVRDNPETSIPPITMSLSKDGWSACLFLSSQEARELGSRLLDAAADAEFDVAERVEAA